MTCSVCLVSRLQVKPVRHCGQQETQMWPTDDFTCRQLSRPADCHKQLPSPPVHLDNLSLTFNFPSWQGLDEVSFTPQTLDCSHFKDLKALGTLLPPGAPPDWAAGWAPCVPLLLLQSTLARTVRTSLQSRRSVRNAALLDLFPPSSTWPPVAILDPAQPASCQI